jgi:hypothetical protein
MHCGQGLFPWPRPAASTRLQDKERVPVPVEGRYTVRARRKAGFREQLSARRTGRALAESAPQGKVGLQPSL